MKQHMLETVFYIIFFMFMTYFLLKESLFMAIYVYNSSNLNQELQFCS